MGGQRHLRRGYLADFAGEFHDLRVRCPPSRPASTPTASSLTQELAQLLLDQGSLGLVYPSIRHPTGACLACFRPAVLSYVRKSPGFRFTWAGEPAPHVTLEEDFLGAGLEAP